MKLRAREPEQRFERATVSLASLGQGLSFLILGLVAVSLLIAGRSSSANIQQAGAFISGLAAPMLDIAVKPAQLIRAGADEAGRFFTAASENQRLRAEVQRLQEWQAAGVRLRAENSELRSLLNVQDFPALPFIAARVIGDLGSPFVRTVLVNAGAPDGVAVDMPVVGAEGLIGRVVAVGSRVSRILLLSDINSRVPVRLEAGGFQAVLTGDNTNLPMLSYLPAPALARAKPGDRIVTSGHGGVFAPDIPVGIIASIEPGGGSQAVIRVQTFADENRLGFVRILQFSPASDLDSGAASKAP